MNGLVQRPFNRIKGPEEPLSIGTANGALIPDFRSAGISRSAKFNSQKARRECVLNWMKSRDEAILQMKEGKFKNANYLANAAINGAKLSKVSSEELQKLAKELLPITVAYLEQSVKANMKTSMRRLLEILYIDNIINATSSCINILEKMQEIENNCEIADKISKKYELLELYCRKGQALCSLLLTKTEHRFTVKKHHAKLQKYEILAKKAQIKKAALLTEVQRAAD